MLWEHCWHGKTVLVVGHVTGVGRTGEAADLLGIVVTSLLGTSSISISHVLNDVLLRAKNQNGTLLSVLLFI